jgi:hypothetical protein
VAIARHRTPWITGYSSPWAAPIRGDRTAVMTGSGDRDPLGFGHTVQL